MVAIEWTGPQGDQQRRTGSPADEGRFALVRGCGAEAQPV